LLPGIGYDIISYPHPTPQTYPVSVEFMLQVNRVIQKKVAWQKDGLAQQHFHIE
jgi:hypothetical protein